ncbi:MAG TPA: GNAT family N-acetyltransferase, partial [Candidatus Omnitrophota bacterium]|nr:GNAT family N-acetyltransferase [Candidatus Omnitrophota bacterium]
IVGDRSVPDNYLYLLSTSVLPEYQRRGIASRMLALLLQTAKDRGLPGIYARVEPWAGRGIVGAYDGRPQGEEALLRNLGATIERFYATEAESKRFSELDQTSYEQWAQLIVAYENITRSIKEIQSIQGITEEERERRIQEIVRNQQMAGIELKISDVATALQRLAGARLAEEAPKEPAESINKVWSNVAQQIRIDRVLSSASEKLRSNEELFGNLSQGQLEILVERLLKKANIYTNDANEANFVPEAVKYLTYQAVIYKMLSDIYGVYMAEKDLAEADRYDKLITQTTQSIAQKLVDLYVSKDFLKRLQPINQLLAPVEITTPVRMDLMVSAAQDLTYLYWPAQTGPMVNVSAHILPDSILDWLRGFRNGGSHNIASALESTSPLIMKLSPVKASDTKGPVIRLIISDRYNKAPTRVKEMRTAKELFEGIEDPANPFRLLQQVLVQVGIAYSADDTLNRFFSTQGGNGIELAVTTLIPQRSGVGGSQIVYMSALRLLVPALTGQTVQGGIQDLLPLAYLTQLGEQKLGIFGGTQDGIGGNLGGMKAFYFNRTNQPTVKNIAQNKVTDIAMKNIEADMALLYIGGDHEAKDVLKNLRNQFYSRDAYFMDLLKESRKRGEKFIRVLQDEKPADEDVPSNKTREEVLKDIIAQDGFYFRQMHQSLDPVITALYDNDELKQLTGTVQVQARQPDGTIVTKEIARIKAAGAEGKLVMAFAKTFVGKDRIAEWWRNYAAQQKIPNAEVYHVGFAKEGAKVTQYSGRITGARLAAPSRRDFLKVAGLAAGWTLIGSLVTDVRTFAAEVFKADAQLPKKIGQFLAKNRTPGGLPLSYQVPADFWKEINSKPNDVQDVMERLLITNGLNTYDGSIWQIAAAITGQTKIADEHTRRLLSGKSGELQSIRADKNFQYGDTKRNLSDTSAYFFRTITDKYFMKDPLDGKDSLKGFPNNEKLHHEDWLPVTGENAWAAILGPLQVAALKYGTQKIPYNAQEVKLALSILPAVEAMQSPIGGVYYAPHGTFGHDPGEISNENNFSLYAGLKALAQVLERNKAVPAAAKELERVQKVIKGMDDYFKNHIYDRENGYFIQGGVYKNGRFEPAGDDLFAVDVQTWGLTVLGREKVDQWFGKGKAFEIWNKTKQAAGYLVDGKLAGVGYKKTNDILSGEWTFGAITMAKVLAAQYKGIDDKAAASLLEDADAMRKGVEELKVAVGDTVAYKYANKRYRIQFGTSGWWANPIPSTASSTWAIFVDTNFNPFELGGGAAFKRPEGARLAEAPEVIAAPVTLAFIRPEKTAKTDFESSLANFQQNIVNALVKDRFNSEIKVYEPGTSVTQIQSQTRGPVVILDETSFTNPGDTRIALIQFLNTLDQDSLAVLNPFIQRLLTGDTKDLTKEELRPILSVINRTLPQIQRGQIVISTQGPILTFGTVLVLNSPKGMKKRLDDILFDQVIGLDKSGDIKDFTEGFVGYLGQTLLESEAVEMNKFLNEMA